MKTPPTQLIPFGDCAEIINGFAFKSDLFTERRAGLPVVRIRDVVRGYSETYYTGEYPENAVVSHGDLLIGMDGEFNVAEWQSGTALLNQRVCKIVARPGIANASFLKHALTRILKRIEDATPFVTVKHLSSEELKEATLPLPPLSEQQRIAGVLEQADRLRRTRRYALELSDSFLPAAFVEMFGQSALARERWSVLPLTELVRKGEKINYGVVQPGDDLQTGVPLIRVADMDDLDVSLPTLKKIANEIDESHSASRLQGDEILIACVGATLG